ncbi:hypothetical protein BKA70DRAFT_1379746 [Coprinopsis sp. MPI-PUGE-AT-0042]|nr:hypothetical protein BKA70DRAFT_1379746 [Coprinopsis sp. MPI-PUGE-AT-0042]
MNPTSDFYRLSGSSPRFAEKIRHLPTPKGRMALVWAHCKSKTTFEPDERQQAVAAVTNGPLSSKMKIFVQSKGSKDDDDVYSDQDLYLLGLSDEYARPEWMILKVLPVPPSPIRPNIIKALANVKPCEQEGPLHTLLEYEQLLQVPFFLSSMYLENDVAGIPPAL